MIPQEHRIIAALAHLGEFVCPAERKPQWWNTNAVKKEQAIQDALEAAGLPVLDEDGRYTFWSQIALATDYQPRHPTSTNNTIDAWARHWCRALGLPFRSAHDQDVIFDPKTCERSTMTAHDRIQLLREERAALTPRLQPGRISNPNNPERQRDQTNRTANGRDARGHAVLSTRRG